MREMTSAEKIRAFMRAVGRDAEKSARIYFVGGASAVLLGWRQATLDVDIRIEADSDTVFRCLPKVKEALSLNVELASPTDFIPELPGWRDRCVFVAREGMVDFFHYDFYAQALELFAVIEPELFRYPALDPASFRASVDKAFGQTR